MRTLTGYLIGVIIVLAVLNGWAWQTATPWRHRLLVFSAGFVLGVIGTCIATFVYGYHRNS